MAYTLLIFTYTSATLWALISILLYGNRPSRSLGWLLVVILLPVLGVILYVLFGINRKKFRFFKLNFNAKRQLYDLDYTSDVIEEFQHNFDSQKFGKVGKLLKKSSGFPAIDGNNIILLKDGDTLYKELFNSLRAATKFIHLQYYIIEKGQLLDDLTDILIERAQNGVEVRILYDAFGSWGFKKNEQAKKMLVNGVEILSILPLNLKTFLSTINYRNHRKIVVVDGTLAFTGGFNISDKYIDHKASDLGIWHDLHLKVEGGIVDHLHRIFIKDHYFACNEKTLLTEDFYLPPQKKVNGKLAQIVAGGPDFTYLSILHQYVMMIHAAEESIYISNPYFIPNKGLLEALKMAKLRGVDVKIMVPKNNDSKVAKYSMFGNFQQLLMTGVKIYLLKNIFSHSKVIIVDKEMVSVGSGNFDYRSFEHNYEANTLIYDAGIAQELATDFEKDIDQCKVLDYETFKNRPVKEKLLEGFAKIFSPLL